MRGPVRPPGCLGGPPVEIDAAVHYMPVANGARRAPGRWNNFLSDPEIVKCVKDWDLASSLLNQQSRAGMYYGCEAEVSFGRA